ncbi:hypothetical protein [Schaalia sp. Marseille-Q2122]|uniref:hypothetical protein n=1 Tax=Schaalia sp. Marseille-Q2122 TaxID=2736604 RepID=UPI001589E8DB|nr:hypothetical protein [Schaalia sp. Marseille-Q2122]
MSCPTGCSHPFAERYVEWLDAYPQFSNAVINGGGILVWYAMPDVVRSRAVRTLLKAGILSAMVHHGAREVSKVSDEVKEAVEEARENGISVAPFIGAGVAMAAVGGVAAVFGERFLFRRGERRRAEGRALAHTRQAVPLALLGVLPVLLDRYIEGAEYEYVQEGEGGCGGNCDCSCGK